MNQQTTTRTLHFTVHPSIINLPRSLYWYEEKQDKAFKILDSLSCGKLNLNQCKDLLEGDAYFITEDGGRTLTLINKPDKKWKEELAIHKKFLEKREKERIKEKEEQQRQLYDKTVSEELEEQKQELNKLKALKYLDDPLDEEINTKKFNDNMAKQVWFEEFKEKDPQKKEHLKLLRESFQNKSYNFVFEGHHYTYQDSARNQSLCPHCDQRCSDTMWNETKDKDSFIGTHEFGGTMTAKCFQCPSCHNHFFYHHQKYLEGVD